MVPVVLEAHRTTFIFSVPCPIFTFLEWIVPAALAPQNCLISCRSVPHTPDAHRSRLGSAKGGQRYENCSQQYIFSHIHVARSVCSVGIATKVLGIVHSLSYQEYPVYAMATQYSSDSVKMANDKVDHIERSSSTSGASIHAHRDKAADVLDDAGHNVVLTHENNKRVLRRIDLYILPVVLAIYFLQALDKATLAYASVFGLVTDAHLVGRQYSCK